MYNSISIISSVKGFALIAITGLHKEVLFQRTPQSCLRKGSKFAFLQTLGTRLAFLNAVTLRDKSGVTLRLLIAQSENNKTTFTA